jgi:hypothetical protein
MTRDEMTDLVEFVTYACPQQKIGKMTTVAWFEIIGHLEFKDAFEAVKAVGRRQPFIAPSEIIGEIAAKLSAEQPHSNACRDQDHNSCRMSWCMCVCHPRAVKALTDPGAVIPEVRALPAAEPHHETGPKRYEPGELSIGKDIPDE